MKQPGISKYLLGLPLFCLASAALAGPPVNYNGWDVTAEHAIDTTASCSVAGITCTTMVEDSGFLIQKVETPGSIYMRYIVTDPTATGATSALDFTAETFVPFAFNNESITQGIASMQVMRDTAGGFEASAELQRSMMRFSDPSMPTFNHEVSYTDPAEMYTMKLSQKITDAANGYVDTFDYTQYTAFATTPGINPDSDDVIGRILDIGQKIDIGEAVDPASKQQFFEHKRRMGKTGNVDFVPFWITQQNNAGNYYYNPGDPISKAGSLTLGGDTVSWADGDEIVSNWLVQELVMSDTNVLSHQTIENRNGPALASETNISAPITTPITPFAWNQDATDNFGPEPIITLP